MKKIFFALTLILLALSVCSCNGDTSNDIRYQDISLNLNDMAESLIENISFDDDLVALSDSVVEASYKYDGALETVVYAGGGATAEKIILVKADNDDDALDIAKKLEEYKDTQIAWFTDYRAQEVTRLNSAYIEIFDTYVVYCVSSNQDESADAVKSFIELNAFVK